jgi:hypothetical protein
MKAEPGAVEVAVEVQDRWQPITPEWCQSSPIVDAAPHLRRETKERRATAGSKCWSTGRFHQWLRLGGCASGLVKMGLTRKILSVCKSVRLRWLWETSKAHQHQLESDVPRIRVIGRTGYHQRRVKLDFGSRLGANRYTWQRLIASNNQQQQPTTTTPTHSHTHTQNKFASSATLRPTRRMMPCAGFRKSTGLGIASIVNDIVVINHLPVQGKYAYRNDPTRFDLK